MNHIRAFEAYEPIIKPCYLTPNNRPYQIGDMTMQGTITEENDSSFKVGHLWQPKAAVESWKRFDLPPNRRSIEGAETPNIPAYYVADVPVVAKTKKLTPTSVIKRLVRSYIADGAESAYDINNGMCVEFADEACSLLDPNGKDEQIHTLSGFDFDPEEKARWDEEALMKFNSPVPPDIDLGTFNYGSHDWLYCHGKHYDAECPQGVTSVFEIPLFTRMVHLARTGKWEKDISLIQLY